MIFLSCPSAPPLVVSLRQPPPFCFRVLNAKRRARPSVSEPISRIRERSRNQNSRRQRRETDQVLGERTCTFRENIEFECPRGVTKGKAARCKVATGAACHPARGNPALKRSEGSSATLSGVLWSNARSFAKARGLTRATRDDRGQPRAGRERREESPERLLGVQARPILASDGKNVSRGADPHESHETHEDWPWRQRGRRFRPFLMRTIFLFDPGIRRVSHASRRVRGE
jgi:hypothetical protein